jgi:predicted transcriptional regulator
MTTIALQQELINKISKIKDKNKLNLINDFLEQEAVFDKNGALILTSEMKKIIALSEEQYKKGEFKTHQEVMAEAELWLKERA